jgi:hypothetical protein
MKVRFCIQRPKPPRVPNSSGRTLSFHFQTAATDASACLLPGSQSGPPIPWPHWHAAQPPPLSTCHSLYLPVGTTQRPASSTHRPSWHRRPPLDVPPDCPGPPPIGLVPPRAFSDRCSATPGCLHLARCHPRPPPPLEVPPLPAHPAPAAKPLRRFNFWLEFEWMWIKFDLNLSKWGWNLTVLE